MYLSKELWNKILAFIVFFFNFIIIIIIIFSVKVSLCGKIKELSILAKKFRATNYVY